MPCDFKEKPGKKRVSGGRGGETEEESCKNKQYLKYNFKES